LKKHTYKKEPEQTNERIPMRF